MMQTIRGCSGRVRKVQREDAAASIPTLGWPRCEAARGSRNHGSPTSATSINRKPPNGGWRHSVTCSVSVAAETHARRFSAVATVRECSHAHAFPWDIYAGQSECTQTFKGPIPATSRIHHFSAPCRLSRVQLRRNITPNTYRYRYRETGPTLHIQPLCQAPLAQARDPESDFPRSRFIPMARRPSSSSACHEPVVTGLKLEIPYVQVSCVCILVSSPQLYAVKVPMSIAKIKKWRKRGSNARSNPGRKLLVLLMAVPRLTQLHLLTGNPFTKR